MGDPYDDFDRYMEDGYRWERKRPRCAYCGRRIQHSTCYKFDGNSDLVCPDCLEDYLKREKDLQLELAIERAEEWYEELTENYLEEGEE